MKDYEGWAVVTDVNAQYPRQLTYRSKYGQDVKKYQLKDYLKI